MRLSPWDLKGFNNYKNGNVYNNVWNIRTELICSSFFL